MTFLNLKNHLKDNNHKRRTMSKPCEHTRYGKNDPFRVSRAPQVCGQEIGQTDKVCESIPTYYIHDLDVWVCGRHLRRTILPECSVCLSGITTSNDKKNKTLPCGHVFHRKCVTDWEDSNRRLTCPMCRKSAYSPMELPEGFFVTYPSNQHDIPENVRRMSEGILMELSTYGQLTVDTVLELEHLYDSNWWVELRNAFCAQINSDGTVQWDTLNREHSTFKYITQLKGIFISTMEFQ